MTVRCTYCGRQDWCDCAIGRRQPPKLCIRGCLRPRKHYRDCPVEDGHDTAWILWEPDFDPAELADADARLDVRRGFYRELAKNVRINRETGALEYRYRCSGCLGSLARHGELCPSCHARLAARLGAGQTGSVLWAFEHLAPDLVPSQSAGHRGKVQESSAPQAAAALGIIDLRQEVLTEVGAWLAAACRAFGLHGPDWWRMRVEEASRRSWAPQNRAELADALRYLATWLDKIEALPGVVQLYDASEHLLARVAAVAPWRARPRRVPGVACPDCECEALAVFEGSDEVTCRRCRSVFPRSWLDDVLRREAV